MRARTETPKSLGPVPAQALRASGTADVGVSKDGKGSRAAQTRAELQVPGTLMFCDLLLCDTLLGAPPTTSAYITLHDCVTDRGSSATQCRGPSFHLQPAENSPGAHFSSLWPALGGVSCYLARRAASGHRVEALLT